MEMLPCLRLVTGKIKPVEGRGKGKRNRLHHQLGLGGMVGEKLIETRANRAPIQTGYQTPVPGRDGKH